jgi:hypothetical protein
MAQDNQEEGEGSRMRFFCTFAHLRQNLELGRMDYLLGSRWKLRLTFQEPGQSDRSQRTLQVELISIPTYFELFEMRGSWARRLEWAPRICKTNSSTSSEVYFDEMKTVSLSLKKLSATWPPHCPN